MAATAGRDEKGRFRPGHSGNPKGGSPGRPRDEATSLADRAIKLQLEHDIHVVQVARGLEAPAGEDERPTRGEVREALDRIARVGRGRIVSRSEVEVSSPEDEAAAERRLRALPEEALRALVAMGDDAADLP